LTRHCPTLTIRGMKSFIVALALAVFKGVANAEIRSKPIEYKQGETVCEGLLVHAS
jgi:hypothetical protein